MNVLLYGRFGQYPYEIEAMVKKISLNIVSQNPDVVITFGGDGTILGAERDYPGVPKLPLRDSKICHICTPFPNDHVLELFTQNKLTLTEFLKLEAFVHNKKMLALNEITIRNTTINTALRFSLSVDTGQNYDDLIGDGLVIATPFGSTAYYKSITKESFQAGIGVAFNNLHPTALRSRIFPENAKFTVNILRGPGTLSFDNNPETISLVENDQITVQKSSQTAKIYTV